MIDPRAEKRRLRRWMVDRILAIDPVDRDAQESALPGILRELPGFATARTVLLYVTAFPEEIATGPMLRHVLESGRRLACPRVDRVEKRLRLFQIDDLQSDFQPGTLGIPEPRPDRPEVPPSEIDWALVPGLAFDDRGFRLGRGAGHYDKLLPTLRPEVPRWALLLEPQWVESLPDEPHDQPLDGAASAGRRLTFRRPTPPPSGGSHTP